MQSSFDHVFTCRLVAMFVQTSRSFTLKVVHMQDAKEPATDVAG